MVPLLTHLNRSLQSAFLYYSLTTSSMWLSRSDCYRHLLAGRVLIRASVRILCEFDKQVYNLRITQLPQRR